jgi:hypothetical protein
VKFRWPFRVAGRRVGGVGHAHRQPDCLFGCAAPPARRSAAPSGQALFACMCVKTCLGFRAALTPIAGRLSASLIRIRRGKPAEKRTRPQPGSGGGQSSRNPRPWPGDEGPPDRERRQPSARRNDQHGSRQGCRGSYCVCCTSASAFRRSFHRRPCGVGSLPLLRPLRYNPPLRFRTIASRTNSGVTNLGDEADRPDPLLQ